MGRSLWADLIQPPYLRYWETPSPGTLTNVHIGTCLVSHRAGVRMKCSHSQSSALVTKPHRSMVYMLFSHGDWEDGTGKWAPQPTDEGVCACVCVCTCAHTRECAKRAAKCPWAGHGETQSTVVESSWLWNQTTENQIVVPLFLLLYDFGQFILTFLLWFLHL